MIVLSKLQASKNVENRAFLSHLTAGKVVANNLSASVRENVAIPACEQVKCSALVGLWSSSQKRLAGNVSCIVEKAVIGR